LALAQLPEAVRAGHRPGDDAEVATGPIVVRTDAAGSTQAFVAAMGERNINFMTVAATNADIQAAIFDAEGVEGPWQPARRQNGEVREGSAVAELTSLVDLSAWPAGTRLIVRREPLHPGAQRSLFPSLEYRYFGFYTDCEGDPVELDVTMRAHAHVEQHIERTQGLWTHPLPLRELRGERRLDDPGAACRGSGPMVPASLLGRLLGHRPAQGAALGHLPRPRTAHPLRPPARRADPRRLARCPRAPRRLPTHLSLARVSHNP